MKKTMAVLLILALVAAVIPAAMADAGTYYVKTANKGYLNVRQTPSSTGSVLTTLNYGTAVNVVSFSNGWAYVRTNKGYGWCMASFLSSTNPNASPVNPDYDHVTLTNRMFDGFRPMYSSAIVNPTRPSGFVNLRWAPSTDAKTIGIRYYGYPLTVLQDNGVWCQVYDETAGVCGFMMKEFMLITSYGTTIK